MAQHVLIIEHGSVAHEASVGTLLTAEQGFQGQRCTWDALGNGLRNGSASLIVAVAVPQTPEVLPFFRSLATRPVSALMFAVLPEHPDEELLRAASETMNDFMFWPVRRQELHYRLRRMLQPRESEVDAVRRRLTQEMGLANLIGNDPAFVRAVQRAPLMGASDAPVLLTGETGTGKELCAHAIHLFSRRSQGPFIPVDCGAVPDNLAESELFGHTRGAFTDAHAEHKGLVALAEGGTLFLDEIDALSLSTQAKLLRFIEERTYRPLGAERFNQASVRVIAATNRNLEELVRQRSFRADLYFRLNVLGLHLPPLRERHGDIELLARHFLQELCAAAGKEQKSLSPAALWKLQSHDWPGNVRELFNLMQRAVVFSQNLQILESDITLPLPPPKPAGNCASFRMARSACVAGFERRYVQELLAKHQGNITRAALEAGKDRRAFGRLVKKYNLHNSCLR